MNNYYDILNVIPNATRTEIIEAYQRLKKIISEDNIAIYGLFSPEMLHHKIQEIELAYQILGDASKKEAYDIELEEKEIVPLTAIEGIISISPLKKSEEIKEKPKQRRKKAEKIKPVEPPEIELEETELEEEKIYRPMKEETPEEYTGETLRKIRINKKITLDEIFDQTKIKREYIQAIEEENFDLLPVRPYMRGFIVSYASVLKLNIEKVVNDYLSRYDSYKTRKEKPAADMYRDYRK